MLGDSSLSDHWMDIFVATLIACIGWVLRRDISAMDKRHERAEDKFSKQDEVLSDHHTRITVLESENERRRDG